MTLRKLQADQLFDGHRLASDRVLIVDPEGTVIDLISSADAGNEVERLEGILTPGLINAHCHLELSHLKDVIPPHTGLIEFLCSVVTKRGFDPAIVQEKIRLAEAEMAQNGIVAVGDIGNTADTAAVKSQSSIRWQNFTEVLSFTDEKADDTIAHFQSVAQQLRESMSASNRTSIVPHAPYSISPRSFALINDATTGQVISMHNQEHPAEDHLYQTGESEYLRLFQIMGLNRSPFPITGNTSLRSVLPHFNNGQTLLLIHNTSTTESDVIWAETYASQNNLQLIWCICINANLYIENKLPPIEMLMRNQCQLVLGTDSYSSNWQLSIGKEIQTIRTHFPSIPLETILQWATHSAAKALQWSDELGTFEKGRRPGIVLLSNDLESSQRLL